MFSSIKLLWSEHPGNIQIKPGNINSPPERDMVLFTKKDLYSPWNIITNSDFYGYHLFAFLIYLFLLLNYTSVSTIAYFCLSHHHLWKESFSILFWSSTFVIKSVYIMYSCFPYPFPPSVLYCKSLQSCPTLCDPIDGSPPGSPVPGILQARTLPFPSPMHESEKWKWSRSVVSDS